MNNETETKPVWTVSTDDESQWLVSLGELWQAHTNTGWLFVEELKTGIDTFSKRRDKSELYDLVHNQTGQAPKRLQNLVSMARNPNSHIAKHLGLGIAHAEAVLGLDYAEAESLLTQAAEQSLSANAIGAIIRENRQRNTAAPNLPDNGNVADQRSINGDVDEVNDMNAVPFDNTKSNILYEEADYSAEADAYAGDAAGYDWADDDLELHPNEFVELLERAAYNLRQHIKLENSW